MSKLLSDEELRVAIGNITDEEFGTGNTPSWLMTNILDLINTQKRLYAESVIGEDEQYKPYLKGVAMVSTDLGNAIKQYKNELRAEQRARIK